MKKLLLMFYIFTIAQLSHAGNVDTQCNIATCDAGTKAITYSSRSEIYYACPTRELSDYTAMVIGLLSLTVEMTGHMPNISDKTGEPEYLDTASGPNMTRIMLDRARMAAKVETFDQAIALCARGKNKVHVTVMNNPKDASSIWVQNDKTKQTFWMSKAMLNKSK